VTVLDTSVVIDFLTGQGTASEVERLLAEAPPAAAPDVLVFEVLAVLRRDVSRGDIGEDRARLALADLGDMSIELFPATPLRNRAFALRRNLTAADGLFVALAESLDEPLATKDRGLARAAREQAAVEVLLLG
jgi:predicted nucleic acid-binding protein